MFSLLNDPHFAERYNKRLAVVVPYRDRATHLARFVPHMVSYFQRDKLDRQIAFSLHIVEQNGSGPFNRGKLKNCGYMLVRDQADYVCFHDVDYLPIWADYSWSAIPARLAWHGLRLQEDRDRFFGAVVLFDKPAFERVNGYSNVYWGWGPEDEELGFRCKVAGPGFERREGTYMNLPHEHDGFAASGGHSEEARAMLAIYQARIGRLAEVMAEDGLSNLSFKTVRRTPLRSGDRDIPNSFHYLVEIGGPETA